MYARAVSYGLAAASLFSAALSNPVSAKGQQPHLINHELIFHPPSNYTDPEVLYARIAELPNRNLLMTWENYSPEPPPVYFPIFESTDSGSTWKEISKVQDQAFHWGLRYQPMLYVLPEQIGEFPAGTLLLAGSSIPTDLSSTHLELYASHDNGRTWEFVSHVAAGGEAVPDNGLTPVWEPFMMVYQNKLIYYYSDQRENTTHGQLLAHQVSYDLKHWGPVVVDVAYPTYTDRPGMQTIAHLPNGYYIQTYEYGGGPNPTVSSSDYTFPVYYRLSKNPEKFYEAEHHLLQTVDGVVPTGSPYVVWTPVGGPNGTIVVSSGCCSQVFINKALGADDAWEQLSTPESVSYTRSLMVFQQDPSYIAIAGAGVLPPSTTNNVTLSVIKL